MVSLAVHYFLYNLGPKHELPVFLKSHIAGNWGEPWLGEVGSRGWMSVRAAITSLLRNNCLASVLRSSITWGGDVDTVASIAMAMASCSKEIKQDLPDRLIKDLEEGEFGLNHLRLMDAKLASKLKQERLKLRGRASEQRSSKTLRRYS